MITIPLWLFIVAVSWFGVALLVQGISIFLTLGAQWRSFTTPEAWVNFFRESWATGSSWLYLLLNLIFALIKSERIL